jgi:beta-glucanase (GH16 family)
MTYVEPGETKVLKLVFGQDSGAPGFDLDPTRVIGVQVFLERPKQATTMLIRDIKAFGSGSERLNTNALTKPADRNIAVTPPEWLGKRPPVPGDWVETLNENFDGNALDAKLWTPRFPWDGPQPGQLQRYTPDNVAVEGGFLKLKAEKRAGHENNDPALGSREFSSGLIQSYDKWTQRYGYFEARVKLPTARGLWPAFWMMPDRGRESGLEMWQRRDTADKGMEIDILEHLCEWGPGRNNVAVHWDGYGSNHKVWGTSHVYFGPTPDGWHNFGLLWEPGKLTWYIDGKKVVEWENERVSSVPSYLKLNIQMGGWATKDVDLSKLPDIFQVDYVRAWQLKDRLEKPAAR